MSDIPVKWCSVWLVSLVLLSTVPCIQAVQTRDLFKTWQARMGSVRDELVQRLNQQETINCTTCSYYACGVRPPEGVTTCLQSNHTDARELECTTEQCGHMRMSMSQAYVRTPPDIPTSSFNAAVNRDVCLTQGLASFFANLRGNPTGFAPWVYFGAAETGSFVSWPGKPRNREEKSNHCLAYDPRIRPWWRLAARHRRNVVVLLDTSLSMKADLLDRSENRWNLTLTMVNSLLDTLSEDDDIQIVAMRLESMILYGRSLIKANDENIKKLRDALSKFELEQYQRPVDIGEGLRTAFDLFRGNGHDGSRKCENHILLFSSSNDCARSIDAGCESKDFAKKSSESLINGTKIMLDFVDDLVDKLEGGFSGDINRPVLFTFSLHLKANNLLSQIACKLNGMHTDLQKEISKRIVNPLQLMQGYFRKVALPIAHSFDNGRMAVSPMYEDDGGLGRLNTFVMPVFYQPNPVCPAVFFGVIGVDMPQSEYYSQGIDPNLASLQQEADTWNAGLSSCKADSVKFCEMQVLRGTEAQCVTARGNSDTRCYQYKNHYYYVHTDVRNFTESKKFCEEQNGSLIAPREKDERRILATIVPPDGAWIDIVQDPTNKRRRIWPGGDEVSSEDVPDIACESAFNENFIMDPRSYEDNFHCISEREHLTTVCNFTTNTVPRVCRRSEISTVIDEDDLPRSIKMCGLEECLLASDRFKDTPGLICNSPKSPDINFNDVACCSDHDLQRNCANDEGLQSTDSTQGQSTNEQSTTVIVVVIVVCAVLLLAVCCVVACCLYSRHHKLSKSSGFKLSYSDTSERKNLQLIVQQRKTDESLISPFEDYALSPFISGGKRPELVVNIQVKVLDNGWEKAGGYGRVRQGEYTDSVGRVHKVAVKFVDSLAPQAAWEALRNEFEILASIPLHPNIVKPIGAHWGDRTENSQRYIVEELMYTNLGDMLHGTDPFPYPSKKMLYRDWIGIYIDIVNGLEHLHQNKIIHFDLKPRNVLLDEKMTAKIADFGCSKSKFDTYIELSAMAGTPPYLAPECWLSYYSQNSRAEVARSKIDIYSFGVIMWECLNGGGSLKSSLYLPSSQPSSSSAAAMSADNIEIRPNQSRDGSHRWVMQHHLKEEIPLSLRELVNACVQFDFDSRPTCEQILSKLHLMLKEAWVDQQIP